MPALAIRTITSSSRGSSSVTASIRNGPDRSRTTAALVFIGRSFGFVLGCRQPVAYSSSRVS